MNINILYIIFAAIVILILVIMVFIIVLNNSKNNLKMNENMALMREALSSNLLKFSNDMNADINNLSERLNSNIIESHKATNEVFNNINEKMVRIDEAQKGLNNLSNEVVSLQKILTDKKSRGSFGEVELYSLLETAYGVNNDKYQKQYHLPNGYIADAVIFGGETLGMFCIDSKFPLENYRRIYDENASLTDKENARKAFKNDVKKHIEDIKNKYIIPGITADLAYMFIPAEAIFAEIYGNYMELIDLSYESKVYLVSPTTLMAYITAIKSIYLGQTKDQKAKEIQALLNDLAIEFERFYNRNENLYKDYLKLCNDFEQLNTTSNKLVKKFNKLNSGDIDEDD